MFQLLLLLRKYIIICLRPRIFCHIKWRVLYVPLNKTTFFTVPKVIKMTNYLALVTLFELLKLLLLLSTFSSYRFQAIGTSSSTAAQRTPSVYSLSIIHPRGGEIMLFRTMEFSFAISSTLGSDDALLPETFRLCMSIVHQEPPTDSCDDLPDNDRDDSDDIDGSDDIDRKDDANDRRQMVEESTISVMVSEPSSGQSSQNYLTNNCRREQLQQNITANFGCTSIVTSLPVAHFTLPEWAVGEGKINFLFELRNDKGSSNDSNGGGDVGDAAGHSDDGIILGVASTLLYLQPFVEIPQSTHLLPSDIHKRISSRKPIIENSEHAANTPTPAFFTLFYSGTSYLPGVLALISSLRLTGSKHVLHVMVPVGDVAVTMEARDKITR